MIVEIPQGRKVGPNGSTSHRFLWSGGVQGVEGVITFGCIVIGGLNSGTVAFPKGHTRLIAIASMLVMP